MRSLPSVQPSVPPPGATDFAAAQRDDDPKRVVKAMLEIADRYPASPLAFDALRTVMKLAKAAGQTDEE